MWTQQLRSMAQAADLQELVQTAVVAAIFAFMLSKLISLIISIGSSMKQGTMRLERSVPMSSLGAASPSSSSDEEEHEERVRAMYSSDGDRADVSGLSEGRADVSEVEVSEPENSGYAPDKPTVVNHGNLLEESFLDLKVDAGYEQSGSSSAEAEKPGGSTMVAPPSTLVPEDDDTSDWEGVESTELDEMFGAASSYVATQAGGGLKVSTDVQLQLYGLYKVATEGPCRTPQPSALKMTARSKWNAWQKIGDISGEEAMERYVKLVGENFPEWAVACAKKSKGDEEQASGSGGGQKNAGMGPVFSTLAMDDAGEGKLDALHEAACEGNETAVLELLEKGLPVDLRDSHGGTPLHWAADRGHLNILQILLSKGADAQAKDSEGQTALHLAALNEQEVVAMYLLEHGADAQARDTDGATPLSLAPASWDWMLREPSKTC